MNKLLEKLQKFSNFGRAGFLKCCWSNWFTSCPPGFRVGCLESGEVELLNEDTVTSALRRPQST